MTSRRARITNKVLDLLRKNPDGLRYSELVKACREEFPTYPSGTIRGSIWDLESRFPEDVYKPERGIFRLTIFRKVPPEGRGPRKRAKEEDFYKPFADWLVEEMEEATKAIPLGGKKFKDKWGTPDVIGVWESKKSDIVKIQTEVISTEVKIDSSNLITAFGQACCYRLFSSKVYLVIPKQSSETDKSRLDSLCQIFGIGLVLFDASSPENPEFEIRTRPIKHDPDILYTNKYLKLIEKPLL